MDFIYVNDLQDKYPNKTILEISDMLKQQGVDQRCIKIRVNCKVCSCEIITTPGTYKKQKTFCCEEHIKHKPKGKQSKFYNRIKTNCTFCGKEIEITPFDFNKKNKFGDSNHFCSQECYWNFRSEYYCGEKGAMYNHQYTEEQKENLARGNAKRFKKIDYTNTSIQIAVNKMLNEMSIEYEREYTLDYYSCDNFLTQYKIIIEVMGDYWHGNPIIYNENKRMLNEIQARTILKDKQKSGYIKNHYQIPILYLWENDINKNLDKCKNLIKKIIDNNGILENYHSFNYSYDNKELKLLSDLIIPYQDMPSSQYKYLINKAS